MQARRIKVHVTVKNQRKQIVQNMTIRASTTYLRGLRCRFSFPFSFEQDLATLLLTISVFGFPFPLQTIYILVKTFFGLRNDYHLLKRSLGIKIINGSTSECLLFISSLEWLLLKSCSLLEILMSKSLVKLTVFIHL